MSTPTKDFDTSLSPRSRTDPAKARDMDFDLSRYVQLMRQEYTYCPSPMSPGR